MSVSDKLGTPSFLEWFIGPLVNHGFLVALIAGLVLTPTMVLLITKYVEGRKISFWKAGFKSFIPGDYALGVLFAVSVALCDRLPEKKNQWYQKTWWHIIVMVGAIAACLLVRKFLDWPNYTRAQMYSPSKLYHDFVLYAGYGYLMFSVAVPALFETGWRTDFSYLTFASWALVLVFPVAAVMTRLKIKRVLRSLIGSFVFGPLLYGLSWATWLQCAGFAAFIFWLSCLIYDQLFQDTKKLAASAHTAYKRH